MECVIPENNLSQMESFCSNRNPFRMSVPGEYKYPFPLKFSRVFNLHLHPHPDNPFAV